MFRYYEDETNHSQHTALQGRDFYMYQGGEEAKSPKDEQAPTRNSVTSEALHDCEGGVPSQRGKLLQAVEEVSARLEM